MTIAIVLSVTYQKLINNQPKSFIQKNEKGAQAPTDSKVMDALQIWNYL